MITTPRYRIGNDMTVLWAINNKDGSPYDMSGKEVRLFMTHRYGREEVACSVVRLPDGSVNNVIRWDFSGDDQKVLGPYALTVRIYNAEDMKLIRKDICEAFELVAVSCMECEEGGDAVINDGGDLILSSKLDIYRFGIPKIYIGSNGNWFIDGVDTGRSALGGGPGLVSRIYSKSDFGGTFDEDSVVDTFNAHAINDLAQRVAFMEGDDYLRLSNMTDVFFQGDLNDKDVLLFDGTYWTNVPLSEIGIGSGGSGSGSDSDYDALSRRIAVFEKMFYWFEDEETIGTKYNFFSEKENSAGRKGESIGTEGGGGSVTVDPFLSDTSSNPVESKAIKAYIDSADNEIKGRIAALEEGSDVDHPVFEFTYDTTTNKATTEMVAALAEAIAENKLILCDGRTYKFILEQDGMYGLVSDAYMDITDGKLKTSILAVTASSYDVQLMEEEVPVGTEITEETVRGWGFTKNAGTITGIKMNGATKGTSGVVDLGNVLTEHQKLKTINNQSIVGEGNIVIQGGGATPRVEMTAESASIEPNKFYVWPMMDSLDLTLGAETSGVMNRYLFQFRNPKAGVTMLTLPDDITWSEDTELDENGMPVMEAAAFYRIEIIEGLASLKKWKLVYINFADAEVERVLMSKDIGDGIGITKKDAAAVTDMTYVFGLNESITEFDEFQYFTGVTRLLSDNISANHGIGFMGCVNLRRLTLPKSLTKLGKGATIQYSGAGAFHSCKALVYIGNTSQLDFVGAASFYLCESLQSIDLSAATNIGDSAFEGCVALSEVLLSDKLAQVWTNAFHGCTALKGNILLGSNITTIAVGAFYNVPASIIVDCPNLSNVGGFMSYKDATFALSGLEEIRDLGFVKTIPGTSAPESPSYCWAGGSAVKRINIEHVTDIGAGAFYDCQSMTEAVICPEVVNIGRSAFGKCTSLALDITDKLLNVTSIGAGAFKDSKIYGDVNVPNLTTMPNAQYNNGHFNGTNVARILSLGTIAALPSGYGAYAGAFANCKNLWYVRVHDVTSMGQYTFYGCTALQIVIVEATTPPSLHNTVFSSTNSTFIIYVPDASVEAYKAATNWNTYADRIKGISEYTG